MTDQITNLINPKVLVADDEPEVLEIMAKRIAAEGFHVITAGDGQEAWEKIIRESPDIIILDLMMPKKDGFEVLRELRETPLLDRWQPVIIVSARRELEDMKQGFSLQADHYITKPCSPEDVIKSIKLMMRLVPQHK